MMMSIREFLNKYVNENMQQAVISGAKSPSESSRVKVRPVILKGDLMYQTSAIQGKKVIHQNYSREDAIEVLGNYMENQFRQLQLTGRTEDATMLISKKGKVTVKVKKHPCVEMKQSMDHNRTKNYILKEGVPVPFLIDLGVMNREGAVVHAKYDKFRQINRFLEFIEDILPELPRDREITILDFGCGKSYLTFAIYYYLKVLQKRDIQIIGLDLKEDVIENCSKLAVKYGYNKLQFLMGDIADYQGVSKVDMVVTLHACDTATDFALHKAILWGAKVILSVPCCQHELNGQITNEMLSPVLSYGILKERLAAIVTDGLRAQLLEQQGYRTQILEFIDMEHTPKNLLIRAVKDSRANPEKSLDLCMKELHVKPTLAKLLEGDEV